jgi:ABC-type glycerol-3-phosphate transport system permease component
MPQLVTLFVVGGRADSQLGVKIAAALLLALPVMIAFCFSKASLVWLQPD